MPDLMTMEGMRHGAELRGASLQTFSTLFEGRFGRMFRTLPPFTPSEGSLDSLADHMFEIAGDDRDLGAGAGTEPRLNPDLPAGYTYVGQFIDHDITFDPASSLQQQNDPDALHDFRTPRFDLDSLYAKGPSQDPFLYDQDPSDARLKGAAFLIGKNVGNGRDLPRNSQGRALIGDPRNDENLIVSQLHCAFLRFHNKLAAHIADRTRLRGQELFLET